MLGGRLNPAKAYMSRKIQLAGSPMKLTPFMRGFLAKYYQGEKKLAYCENGFVP